MQENVVVLLHTRKDMKMENLVKLNDKLESLRKWADILLYGLIFDESNKKAVLIEFDECISIVIDEIERRQLEDKGYQVERELVNRKEYEVDQYAGPLEQTINLMISDDYKLRFKAEYYQTKIRYDKLHKMLIKEEAGTLDFKTTCPIELLQRQKESMGWYLHALEVRAEIEGIEI